MPAPTTTDELLDLLRTSGLIEPERLDAFAAKAATDPGPASPRHWAGLLVGTGFLTRFQSEQILLGKWRGFTVGRYKVLERLGSGGAGTVYLCEHVKVRRKVAVKVLPTVRASNPAAVGRFHREARAAGVLNHPNLVKCHDIDQDGELHYLVMEYVDGASLHEVVARTGPMDPVRAAQYIRQAALGLQHAHEAGLVHRDIKPANLMVDRSGTVRLLDLGLARFYHDDNDLLTLKYDENNVLGTADYVAPEQALNSHGVDIRADIYSLGCTFYFILAGRPPFPGGKAAQKLIWHQVKPPTPVRNLRPEVPEKIAAVVAKMLSKDPRERYQTPAELAVALEPWSAEPVPPPRDEEMPQLCPAAARSVSAPEIETGATTPSALGRATASARASGHNSNAEGVVPLLAPQGPRPASMADVATPSAMASPTAPDSGKHSVRRPMPQPTPEQRARARKRAVRIASLLAVSVAIGMCLRLGIGRMRGTAETSSFAVYVVSHSGAPGTLSSIQEALFRTRPGDHVQVADAIWEESLHLTGEGGTGRGVVLEGCGDRPVIWRTPRGHRDDQPLVYLSCVPGLQLRNFILDGQDRVKDLIALSGPCPGLTLEDLQLTGFGQAAIALNDCVGEADQPVMLQRLRTVPVHSAVSALRFDGRPGEGNHFVHVQDSRLEGPYTAAVSFSGPVSSVEFVRNRFFNSTDGLFYLRSTPPAALGLTLASNTFCNITGVAIRFETSPPAEGSRVVLTSNLFAHTGTLARVDDFFPRPSETQAAWIWVDEVRSGSDVPAEQRAFRKTFTIEETPLARGRLDLAVDAGFIVWLNGDRIGQGEFLPQLQRVQSFDVSRSLRPGRNVLAVQGTIKKNIAGILAQLTYTARGAAPVAVVSDASWRSFRSLPDGWQSPLFDDSDWPTAKVVSATGQGPAEWRHLIWDGIVEEHYSGAASRLFPDPAGNVRDWTSEENFPPLRAVPLDFSLPTDAKDDAHFLRYGRASLLTLAGSPGVAPPEKAGEK
jgi:eukaryotic-like serine/threonine-protein kinase